MSKPSHEHLKVDSMTSLKTALETLDLSSSSVHPSTSSTLFIYPPLKEGEIRLLSLQPGDFDSPILITLENIGLNKTQNTYEALSYAWGNRERTLAVNCNGSALKITPSLEIALRYLRHENKPRLLWIDAICINQGSFSERDEQVPLMRHIYPSAKCVVVWLGEEDPLTAPAIETFEKLAKFYTHKGIDRFKLMKEQFKSHHTSLDSISAAQYLTLRPWFNRCWAFQEIILSKNAEIVCGNFTIPWETFSRGIDTFRSVRRLFPSHLSPNWNASRMVLAKWVRSRRTAPNYLSRILHECDSLKATYPEDRLFSLLSLVDFKNPSLFQVRYGLSVSDTYILFTRAIIKEELSLCILSQCGRTRYFLELPSWVPDWSGRNTTIVIGHESQHYKDVPDYIFESTYSVNLDFKGNLANIDVDTSTELVVQGAFVDTVSHVHNLSSVEFLSDLQTKPVDWRFPPGLNAFAEEIGLREKHRCGQSLPEEVLLRTLSADIWYYTTRRKTHAKHWPSHELLSRALVSDSLQNNKTLKRLPVEVARKAYGNAIPKHFVDILETVSEDEHISTQLNEMPNGELQSSLKDVTVEALRYANKFAYRRALFFTSHGYIGIGSKHMKPGDALCTLFGSDVPFILKPLLEDSNKFKLISECYVDGIMDGELFNLSEDKQTIKPIVDGVEVRDFTLV